MKRYFKAECYKTQQVKGRQLKGTLEIQKTENLIN